MIPASQSVNNNLRPPNNRHVGRHSAKPQEVHHRIEELYGPQRRIELFARRQVSGWDAVGDGIDGRDIREVLVGA